MLTTRWALDANGRLDRRERLKLIKRAHRKWLRIAALAALVSGCGEALETKKEECIPRNACGWFRPCNDGYECVEISSGCEGKTAKVCKPEKGGWKMKSVEVEAGPVKVQMEKQPDRPKLCTTPSGWTVVCADQ